MMSENLRVLLFDVDDTLFDRRRAQGEVLRKIVRQTPAIQVNIATQGGQQINVVK